MRVMVIFKANKDSEAGKMPTERSIAAMMKFNEELAEAGIMLGADGLHPSSKGKRVRTTGGETTVIDGPYTGDTRDIIAGFWLWQVDSMEQALEWVKRVPNPENEDGEIEIRPLFEAADFGKEFTPELKEREKSVRAKIEHRLADLGRKLRHVKAA